MKNLKETTQAGIFFILSAIACRVTQWVNLNWESVTQAIKDLIINYGLVMIYAFFALAIVTAFWLFIWLPNSEKAKNDVEDTIRNTFQEGENS